MKKILFTIIIFGAFLFSVTSADTYTTELQSAYTYAYNMNITTQSSISGADIYGSLIRSHMAKMIVNYAKEVLNITPDTSLPCVFTDISNQSTELKNYITQACQMGLMGVGITQFNPDAVVTRAQFGTVLSRALYGDTFNGGDPYYIHHLQALKDSGIMNDISNPDVPEVRGYVMVMMMRAGGNVEDTPSVCDIPANQLACMVNASSCPSDCQQNNETTIHTGTLQVSSTTISVWSLPLGVKYLWSLNFTAIDQNIFLTMLTFQKIGTFADGWIEDDGVRIATIQSLPTSYTLQVLFAQGVNIKKWTSKTLSIFIEGNNKNQQWVVLLNTQNIQSTANSIEGKFPYTLLK